MKTKKDREREREGGGRKRVKEGCNQMYRLTVPNV